MWFGVITLFPEMFSNLQVGITGRALQRGNITLNTWNPRQFTKDKHQTVDDKPYGGGPGMVMMAEPISMALKSARSSAPIPPHVIYLSPQGKLFNQQAARELLQQKAIIFIAGRYEGIDERIIEQEVDEEWSIGDYVLSGGELAAMVIIDTITRMLPGVIGDAQSVVLDSHFEGLLKYPQYTRPAEYFEKSVPPVLLSGNHQQIALWRKLQALGRTWQRRPDLLTKLELSEEEKVLLAYYKQKIA